MDINLGLSAVATGVDTITATYSPAPTLVDKKILFLRTAGTNTVTAPTFSPNGLTAQTITKNNGDALAVGDLDGDVILMYDLANTNWELLTPKVTGGSQTLAQVLATDNKTGAQNIVSDDGFSILTVQDGLVNLEYNDGATQGYLYSDATGTRVFHDVLVELNAPSVTKNGVEVATVNDLTGKLDTTVPLLISSTYFNWASTYGALDSTTLYFGDKATGAPNGTATNRQFRLPTGVLRTVAISTAVVTVLGSSEGVTINLRNITDGISTLVTNTMTWNNVAKGFVISGLSIATDSSKDYAWELINPIFATNPTGITLGLNADIFNQ